MANDLCTMTLLQLNRLFREKKVSPVEVCQAVFKRLHRLNPHINAFQHIDEESAFSEARASEKRWQDSKPLGLVDGIPVTVKDNIMTKGWPSLSGSRTINPDQNWNEDAPSVTRLREQGVIFLGKTTMPEFAWKVTTDSPLFGVTRNPWNLNHTPGGSSGGAAAATVAGMGTIALASDGGGSIRVPASHCNLVGIKSTHGRVSDYPPSSFGTCSNIGPITRCVSDTALIMDIIAKRDHRDWYSLPDPVENYLCALSSTASMANINIAYSRDLGMGEKYSMDAEVVHLTDQAAQKFIELGMNVEEVEFDEDLFKSGDESYVIMRFAMLASLIQGMTRQQQALMDPDLLEAARMNATISLGEYLEAEQTRRWFGSRLNLFFNRFDFLITPTIHCLPGEVDATAPEPFLTMYFNASRHPAISLPCGFSKKGLPVGIQIVSGHYNEAVLLELAHLYEQATQFGLNKPDLG